jgi:arylsulfatase
VYDFDEFYGSAHKQFIYSIDDGDLVAMRYENWKVVFGEQRAPGTMRIWAEPFTKLRVEIYNLPIESL